ncbi:MAG: hypothetical protein H6587_08110 [Flavobacteriales bacterium]|nr:hypothetical protein [Flavobacteriales bacterium]MCB9364517.1 hypothetical protein [Flavobacteriales bacterium]
MNKKTFLNKKLSVIGGILFNTVLIAQTDNYIKYYRNIEQAYQQGIFNTNNDSTIFYMNKAFKEVVNPFPEDLLVTAQAYLGKGNNEKYYELLLMSIKMGLDSSMINKYEVYHFLNAEQKRECNLAYNNYQFSIDTNLYLLLDSVCKEDQRVRRQLDEYETREEGNKYVEIQDSLNREWIFSIIKTKGWPGRKIVGNDSRSFILLVHLKQYWMDEHFDLLKTEIVKGNLNPSLLAGVFDKNSYFFENKQINYNSFLPGNFIAQEKDEEVRLKNRWEIGALSRKVYEIRNTYKYRKKNFKAISP